MSWMMKFLSSSIGKKQLMAVTGAGFCFFLTTHLLGNLSIFRGLASLDAYAEKLHSLGPLINAAELGLLAFAAIHVTTASLLFIQNRRARPQRYEVGKSSGGKTISSMLMPYTGIFIFIFVVIHLLNFHFADRTGRAISDIVAGVFANPAYIAFYLASMVVVALHVRHGFWSAFQTVGANHPKYMPAIQAVSIFFALAVAGGYGSLPVFVMLAARGG